MVHRGFCGVNRLSRSQALSSVVEVAQGVFLPMIFGFDLEFKERPLISCDARCLDFVFLSTDTNIYYALSSRFKCCKYIAEVACRILRLNYIQGLFSLSNFSRLHHSMRVVPTPEIRNQGPALKLFFELGLEIL